MFFVVVLVLVFLSGNKRYTVRLLLLNENPREIPLNLRSVENLNLFGIFCVLSISLFNAEAVAGTQGFPSNFRSYTRTFAQWRLRLLFQCRYKITEKGA